MTSERPRAASASGPRPVSPSPTSPIHCFTEDPSMAEQVVELGFYVSFSGIATFKNAPEVREAIGRVPLERTRRLSAAQDHAARITLRYRAAIASTLRPVRRYTRPPLTAGEANIAVPIGFVARSSKVRPAATMYTSPSVLGTMILPST